MTRFALAATMLCAFFVRNVYAEDIITFYEGRKSDILERKADYIPPTEEGLKQVNKIADKLMRTLKPRMPLPGLSAPQIGISKQVFIYSWDKSWKNMVIVINPRILDTDAPSSKVWEVSQSSISPGDIVEVPLIRRPESIQIQYMDINGDSQHKFLSGFAARAFQHFYDHLQGKNHIKNKRVRVRTFPSYAEFDAFVKSSRKGHDPAYHPPRNIAHE